MNIVPAMCFVGTDTPNNKCLPYKKVFKWRFLYLERNNRPKIRLQNVKACQFRMFHSQINVLAGDPKKDQERNVWKGLTAQGHPSSPVVAIVSLFFPVPK